METFCCSRSNMPLSLPSGCTVDIVSIIRHIRLTSDLKYVTFAQCWTMLACQLLHSKFQPPRLCHRKYNFFVPGRVGTSMQNVVFYWEIIKNGVSGAYIGALGMKFWSPMARILGKYCDIMIYCTIWNMLCVKKEAFSWVLLADGDFFSEFGFHATYGWTWPFT